MAFTIGCSIRYLLNNKLAELHDKQIGSEPNKIIQPNKVIWSDKCDILGRDLQIKITKGIVEDHYTKGTRYRFIILKSSIKNGQLDGLQKKFVVYDKSKNFNEINQDTILTLEECHYYQMGQINTSTYYDNNGSTTTNRVTTFDYDQNGNQIAKKCTNEAMGHPSYDKEGKMIGLTFYTYGNPVPNIYTIKSIQSSKIDYISIDAYNQSYNRNQLKKLNDSILNPDPSYKHYSGDLIKCY